MKSLPDRIALLQKRARDMASLVVRLSAARSSIPAWVGDRREEVMQEASFQAALAMAQLDELAPVHQAFTRGAETANANNPAETVPVLASEILDLALGELARQALVSPFAVLWDTDPIEAIAWRREYIAVRSLMRNTDRIAASGESDGGFEKAIERRLASLTEEDQVRIRRAARDYLANQWIYPWARTRSGELLGSRYRSLLNVAQVPSGDASMFEPDVLKRLLKGEGLNSNDIGIIGGVLEQVERAISEYGFDALADILESGGNPLPGSRSDVGIIPGQSSGPCPRILVAIATSKSSRSKFGAIPVSRKLREALISCCDGGGAHPRTEVAIFVGPLDSIEGVIDESAGDIERHLSKGTLKVFIPIGVLRDRMNVLDWR